MAQPVFIFQIAPTGRLPTRNTRGPRVVGRPGMFDLVRLSILVAALVGAVRARLLAGVVLALACFGILAVEIAVPLLLPVRPLPVASALAVVFFGPSSLPSDLSFMSDLVLARAFPLIASTALTTVAAIRAMSLAALLRPETRAARRLDHIGLAFVASTVATGLLLVAVVLMRLISPPL